MSTIARTSDLGQVILDLYSTAAYAVAGERRARDGSIYLEFLQVENMSHLPIRISFTDTVDEHWNRIDELIVKSWSVENHGLWQPHPKSDSPEFAGFWILDLREDSAFISRTTDFAQAVLAVYPDARTVYIHAAKSSHAASALYTLSLNHIENARGDELDDLHDKFPEAHEDIDKAIQQTWPSLNPEDRGGLTPRSLDGKYEYLFLYSIDILPTITRFYPSQDVATVNGISVALDTWSIYSEEYLPDAYDEGDPVDGSQKLVIKSGFTSQESAYAATEQLHGAVLAGRI